MKPEIRVQVAPSGTKYNPYEVRIIGPYGWRSIIRAEKLEAICEAKSIAYILDVKPELPE